MKELKLSESGSPLFIAEAGVNHNGDLDTAEALIDAAADAGADAVKFQTFAADRLVSADADTADYQTDRTDADSQREMLRRYELDRSDHERLIEYADEREITFLSTPFDPESATMLADLGVRAIKLGSGELDNHPLLEHVAELGLPTIVSTGMGTMEEVEAAYRVVDSVAPQCRVVFLHCVSAYPTPLNEVNLAAMQTLDDRLPCPVGFSDHTIDVRTPGLAVAAGATVVEKHLTLDRSMEGPDHESSLEPDELAAAVDFVKTAATVRGDPEKRPTPSESANVEVVRKSIHAANDLSPGTRIDESDLVCHRPATGLSPREYDRVVGSTVLESVDEGEALYDGAIDTGS